MNDSEIIKALECHTLPSGCNDCPYVDKSAGRCSTAMVKDALDLINRQQAEIERLTAIVETAIESTELSADFFGKKAVREFVERLKEHSCNLIEYDEGGWSDTVSAVKVEDIDRLLEKMGCNDG